MHRDRLQHRQPAFHKVGCTVSAHSLSARSLRQRWVEVTGSVVPRVSPSLLRLALAWELQAKAWGGLSREATRALDQRAAGQIREGGAFFLRRDAGGRYELELQRTPVDHVEKRVRVTGVLVADGLLSVIGVAPA